VISQSQRRVRKERNKIEKMLDNIAEVKDRGKQSRTRTVQKEVSVELVVEEFDKLRMESRTRKVTEGYKEIERKK